MKDQTAYRVTACSSSVPTLEFESLPILGEDRERGAFRAKAWRWAFLALAACWGVVVWLVARS